MQILLQTMEFLAQFRASAWAQPFLFHSFYSLRPQVRKNLFSRITDNLLIEIFRPCDCREQIDGQQSH